PGTLLPVPSLQVWPDLRFPGLLPVTWLLAVLLEQTVGHLPEQAAGTHNLTGHLHHLGIRRLGQPRQLADATLFLVPGPQLPHGLRPPDPLPVPRCAAALLEQPVRRLLKQSVRLLALPFRGLLELTEPRVAGGEGQQGQVDPRDIRDRSLCVRAAAGEVVGV